MLIRLYERNLNIFNFLEETSLVKGGLSISIRYLFLLLLSFEELRKVSFEEAQRVGDLLSSFIQNRYPGEERFEDDKQFIFYVLKVGDFLFFDSIPVYSMLGKKCRTRPVMECYTFNNERVNETLFWETYYRHNNFFLKHNPTLFDELRIYTTKRGLETIADTENKQYETLSLMRSIYSRDGNINDVGHRAMSLNDIIRFMIFLKMSLVQINSICSDITEKFSLDRKLAYAVFRETEDEFSTRPMYSNTKKSQECCIDKNQVWMGVFRFISPKEGLELVLSNKIIYKSNKDSFVKNVLKNYNYSTEVRHRIWKSLIGPVLFFK